MSDTRPKKVIRLNFLKVNPDLSASISIYGEPNEIRISASPKNFISVKDQGISLSPGFGNQVNIQGMSQNLKYAGLLMDLPFPLSILPVTPATPTPQQIVSPPLGELLPLLQEFTVIASRFLAV